ncbi:class II aldolase/adducin family protein [Pikeienuella piscinae]|uniref:Class II aldolase/adducin family protein n=1 Tax=Pikeienuella piscinae TaxID=2748098 RepID=A0A7L5C0K2_9RHOB|nr:class II aldolase/adducin family protein [Pikeienuella piscinae]QIE56913.1 class II aldolase/adducin family protein [Pikeienuella piscinae]
MTGGDAEATEVERVLGELVLANRILANERVIDDFGHVSVRHPADQGRYFIARALSPSQVTREDIQEFTLDSAPTTDLGGRRPYAERALHGCVYAARADVGAVVHHHAPPILPFTITGERLRPVVHLGSVMGEAAPLWDSQDEFGDTTLLVDDNDKGASMARALGGAAMVLIRRHGATVVGDSIRDAVFTAIHSTANARLLLQALALGAVQELTKGEIEKARALHRSAFAQGRAWDFWLHRAGLSEA